MNILSFVQLSNLSRYLSKSWITIAEGWNKVIFLAKHLAGIISH